ncbi:MAG: amidohydrolase [Chloroflexales bacterium]|nr:amidohydrolase [Chloroflexales bacterium]
MSFAPNLIIHNAKIITLDPTKPIVEAIACLHGRVVATGSNLEILPLAGVGTKKINLNGATVIPGFNDSHNHMLEVGIKMTRISLDDCKSLGEMRDLVAAAAKNTPPGQWIIGEGWNESFLVENRVPTRADIDAATDQHPVLLKRFFNMDTVNSVALRLAGVDATTPDPAGGSIERYPDGTPNGILRAAAKLLVRNLLPAVTEAEAVTGIEKASTTYLSYGITSIQEPGLYPWEMRAYMAAHRYGKMKVRTSLMPSWHGFREEEIEAELDDRAANLGLWSGLGDEMLRLTALKMAVDGGTTSRTAWMFKPFVGESVVRDFNRLDPADLRRYFRRGHDLGWDIGIHAIGDRAHHESALAFADAVAANPRDHRHNIIHAYFASEESLDAMAKYKIGAVIQPTFIYFEGDDLFRDVGEELAHEYKPAKTYLKRGIPMIASSDIPSTFHYNPFISLYSLVTRKTHKGTVIAPKEAISRMEALRSYTASPTWLTREEHLKGVLMPGMLADMAVFDRDYLTCSDDDILNIKVTMTVLGGNVVYERA